METQHLTNLGARGAKVRKKTSHTGPMAFHIFLIGIFLFAGLTGYAQEQVNEVKRAKIFDEIHPLLSETDLYCSIFVQEGSPPDLRIVGSEREYERELITDGDVVYVNQGEQDGLATGQLFLVYELGPNIPGFGTVAVKHGRARILALSDNRASATIEKSCGAVTAGNYLVPFREEETFMGKDQGYDAPPFEAKGLKGTVIYLQRDFNQIASGHWAVIDLGEEQGVQVGQQLTLYRIVQEGAPLQIFGNSVVIDTQAKTATIKVLSCRDALRIGDLVQDKTQ